MSARQRNPFAHGRPAGLLATCLALAVGACGGDTSGEGSREHAGDAPVATLDWRQGSGQGMIAHDRDREVVRCWKVQGRFDCLLARSTGLEAELPGAPGRLLFFGFRVATLPATRDDLDRLATSDGYACELSTLPDRSVLTETYWASGRIAHQRAGDRDRDGNWTAADVAVFQSAAGGREARPFFACDKVIGPVLDVGPFALDSGLVTYDSVFAAPDVPTDAPVRPVSPGNAGESGRPAAP